MTTQRGLRRNDPCWCGSGKKFKKCHLYRDRQPVENPYVAAKKVESFCRKQVCLHACAPDQCSEKVIRAHTIQRGGSLTKIAENNHVLGFSTSMGDLNRNGGDIGIKPIGINQASTFSGFCSLHDNDTFAPVEDHPFTGNDEQCFLLAYRALCRELYQKQTTLDAIAYMRTLDRGRPIVEQIDLQNTLDDYELFQSLGLRDLEYRKREFDRILLEQSYSDVSNFVVFTNAVPDVLAAFGATVQHDFHGNELQDLSDESRLMDSLYTSIIATESGGAIVLSWCDLHSMACTRFMQSLATLSDQELPSAIVRFVFEYSENTFFRPAWWNGLDASLQSDLVSRISSGAELFVPRKWDCLRPNGKRYVDWSITRRQSNRVLLGI